MERYDQIIQGSRDPVLTLSLERKTGAVPKGSYQFLETYCTDACDCRRVLLVVVNEKKKQKAAIKFGFDQQGPFAGPYLDQSSSQAPYASQLLDFFVDSLNSSPEYLERLYRHYVQVREQVERKRYQGKPFPQPGKLVYRATPPPDLEAEMLESLKNLRASGRAPRKPEGPERAAPRPAPPSREEAAPRKAEPDLASFVRRYAEAGVKPPIEVQMTLRKDLHGYFLEKEEAGEELARLLPELCRRSPQDEDAINAGLRLLYDALNLLEQDLATGGAAAGRRMEQLQNALARQVFVENEDLDLIAAVWNIVVQSGVEVLPELREATGHVITDGSHRLDLHDAAGEDIVSGITRSLESIGVTSPFEGAEEILQLLSQNEPDVQTALIGEMLTAEKPLLREISALMLFHPDHEVRLGVAQLLAGADARTITSETLRRLIISRNWFPEQIRGSVDQTVSKARKARVECAALHRPDSITVYASGIDGSGEQAFQVIVPDGNAFSRCSIVLQQQAGVAGALVVALKSRGEVANLVAVLKKESGFIESSTEHLDLRVCHALADGARAGNVPDHWLVQIAELLGRDRWKPVPFDSARELLLLWDELEARNAKLLDPAESRTALEASAEWQSKGFLSSWQEDEQEVRRDLEKYRGSGKSLASKAAAAYLVDTVLERRRPVWLQRLVVTALWLLSCDRPPVPWHHVFHVAQAVADETVALKEIPLLVTIAENTIRSYTSGKKSTK